MTLRITSTCILVFEVIMRIILFAMIVNEINKSDEEKINLIETIRFLLSVILMIIVIVSLWLI